MENKNNNVDRGNLKQNLSEKFSYGLLHMVRVSDGRFYITRRLD